jgi:glycosyltransferase involved in cell wall biosynthesis
LPSRTFLFLQNRYLCEPVPFGGFGIAVRLRIGVERLWLRRRLANVSRVIVQTPSMRESVLRHLRTDAAVVAFAADAGARAEPRPAARPPAKRFLYPASADPHKNHAALIEAWRRLRAEGIEAELHLTLPRHVPMAREVERRAQREGLSIVNHGEVEPSRMRELYALADALIFPSLRESFGLPLAEAQAAGLPIIAAERDYVRDVAEPAQTFDPASAVSIARAVRRFMGAPEPPAPIISAAAFIERLLAGRV